MARSTRVFAGFLFLAVVALWSACDRGSLDPDRQGLAAREQRGPNDEPDTMCLRAQRVAVTPAAPSVAFGDSVQLIATPLDSNGVPVDGCSLAWSRSEPQRSRVGPNRRVAVYAIIAVSAAGGAGAAVAVSKKHTAK